MVKSFLGEGRGLGRQREGSSVKVSIKRVSASQVELKVMVILVHRAACLS